MPLTPETWRNDFTNNAVNSDSHTQAKVTQLTNGNILVVWANSADPASGAGSSPESDVIGRIYDSLGNALGGEIQLNTNWTADTEFLPDVLALEDGGFAVAYNSFDFGTGGQEWDIHLQEWNANGTPRTGQTIVQDTFNGNFFQNATMAQVSATSLMVAYSVNGNDLRFKLYNPSANTVGTEVTVWSGGTGSGEGIGSFDIVELANGTYGVAFVDPDAATGGDDIFFYRYSGNGGFIGASTIASNAADRVFDLSATTLTNGNVAVSYSIDNTGGTDSGVRYQLLNSSGGVIKAETSPMTTVAGNQDLSSVVALDNGRFMIVWWDEDTLAIHARQINNAGNAVGSEFDVVDYGGSTVKSIDTQRLEDGRVAVTWNADINNTSDRIFTEILDTRDNFNTTPAYTDDQVIGTIGNDTLNPVPAGTDKIFGHNGNDLVWFNFNNEFSVDYDGGSGTDTLGLLNASGSSYNFLASDIDSVEVLQFNNGGTSGQTRAFFNANEFTSFTTLNFAQSDAKTDYLEIRMNTATIVNYTSLTLIDYDADEVTIYIRGDSNVEAITGTTGNDIINGGAGDDVLDGGAGVDTFDMNNSGYTGNTTVNLATTIITSNIGTEDIDNFENVIGAGTNDRITGTSARNIIEGNGGNDTITGSEGRDESYGGSGNDRIIMTEDWLNNGVEVMAGGSGTDTLVIQDLSTGNQVIQFTNESVTSFEELEFNGSNAGAVNLTAVFSAAQFNGSGVSLTALIDGYNVGGETETLRVSMGAETTLDLSGLTFQDWGGQDEIVEIFGDNDSETITGTSQNDDIFGNNGNNTLNGGAGNDVITGGTGVDIIDGGAGADIMEGGIGNDTYVIGLATDSIIELAGQGIDTVVSFLGSTTLDTHLERLIMGGAGVAGNGNASDNTIVGTSSNNNIQGNGGSDYIVAGGGNDQISGGTGADFMFGNTGNDRYIVGTLNDRTIENAGEGTDTVVTYVSSYLMEANVENMQVATGVFSASGNGGNNVITAGNNNNLLYGGSGNDSINAGGGNDIISGDNGADTLTGGAGADRFDYNAASHSAAGVGTRDTITDFTAADVIDLSTIDASVGVAGNGAFAWRGTGSFTGTAGELRYDNFGGNALVSADRDGDGSADMQILVLGNASLAASDFIL